MPRNQMAEMMKFTIPCDEANHICDKSQYKEASLLEKVKLNLHLIYCRACRKYTSRNQKLTRALRNAQLKGMPRANKNRLRELLRQEMNK